jgi:3-dehydroquinate synthase
MVALGDRTCPVLFRNGAVAELATRIAALGGVAHCVTDAHVDALHGAALRQALDVAGVRHAWSRVPPGEVHKTLATVAGLYDELLARGISRRDVVVAFGGGVVGDLAGFVAGTILRGVRWIAAPTTLLAQVDASVGGKTGVDHALGKNLIGVFHQPTLVFADAAWLATLPRREIRSGLAEVLKHGAIADAGHLERVVAEAPRLLAGDGEALRPVIAASVAIKARFVAADERDEGCRALLNFGHTFGHAIEAEAGGELTHGEAVALGMRIAARLSVDRGGLTVAELDRLDAALDACELAGDWRPWLRPAVLRRLAADKKAAGGVVNLILLRELGRAVIDPVPLVELTAAAEALARLGGDVRRRR